MSDQEISERKTALTVALKTLPQIPIKAGQGWITNKGAYVVLTQDEAINLAQATIRALINERRPAASRFEKESIELELRLHSPLARFLAVDQKELRTEINGITYLIYKI